MRKIAFFVSLLAAFISVKAQTFTEYQDQKVNRVNCEPFRAYFIPHANEESALTLQRENSSQFMSLNGKWKLSWVKDVKDRPSNFFEADFNDAAWKEEAVPCNVEMQGYGEPIYTNTRFIFPVNPPFIDRGEKGNPVTSYRKKFTLPEGWKDQRVTIHFNGVQSCIYLWINGRYVGFHEDAMTTAEFDLTPYLQEGENVLAAQVFRFSDGSYLEDQDMWWLSGIYRDVYLVAEPKVHVEDFAVVTDLNSNYRSGKLQVKYSLRNSDLKKQKVHDVHFRMIDERERLVFDARQLCRTTLGKGEKKNFNFVETMIDPMLWSAERPTLYKLVINLLDARGKVIQSICQEVGFRKVEIIDGMFFVNGRQVYIKGTNHHDQNPTGGRYMPLDMIEKDLRLMKEYNINAVRTSHYPKTPQFYELCNRLGIYVWDEANNESHGAFKGNRNLITNDESWQQAFLERGMAMVYRDRNQPSVLVWSMGNECGGNAGDGVHSNFYALRDSINKLDPWRPVHYEGHGTDFDIIAFMYCSVDDLKKNYDVWPEKPIILCEYVHAMGNSGGGIADYWNTFYQYDRMQGGFVWDWADQGLKTIRDGKSFFANGWDRGPGEINDGDFCFNGLVSADRKPHGELFEIKQAYQPARITPIDVKNGVVKVMNTQSFTNLSDYEVRWELQCEGEVIESGDMYMEVEPLETDNFRVPFTPSKIDPSKGQHFLTLRFFEKNNRPWVSKGHEVGYAQEIVTPAYEKQITRPDINTKLQLKDEKGAWVVTAGEVKYGFDKLTGTLSSVVIGGEELMAKPSRPNFARPPIANERKHFATWEKEGYWNTQPTLINMHLLSEGVEPLKIASTLSVGSTTINVLYAIYSNGELQMTTALTPEKEVFIGKLGWQFYLKRGFDNVNWVGNEVETYCDRFLSNLVKGNYNKKLSDLWMEYEVPQENGNRAESRWVTMTNDANVGLYADAAKPFNFSAYPYDDAQIKSAGHPCYLEEKDYVTFNLDAETQGVGTAACGPDVLSQYRVYLRSTKYMFRLKPFNKAKEQPATLYKTWKAPAPFNAILGGAGSQQDDVPINIPIVIQSQMSNKLLTVGENNQVVQWERDVNRPQTFRFEPMSFGWFRIVEISSGKVLGLRQRSRDNGMDLQLQDFEGGDYQLWTLRGGRGAIQVINKWANKPLDVNGKSQRNGENLVIWEANGGNNQDWTIYKQNASAPTKITTASPSLLANYGFEDKGTGIPGWNVLALTSNDNIASIEYNGYNSTSKYLKMNSPSEYRGYVYQRIEGLEEGNYEVTAMLRSSGGQAEAFLSAFSGEAPAAKANIKASGSWTPVTVRLKVVNGKCEVGFFTTSTAKQWIAIDNVILKKVK